MVVGTTVVPGWELRRVSKLFPGVVALSDVSLKFVPGRIHGLIGTNGSGKSTLVKILSGVLQPDHGTILHNGRAVRLRSARAAHQGGVATIYQELSLVPSLTVGENIYLGVPPRGALGAVRWPAIRRGATTLLKELGIDLDPNRIVSTLSMAERQLVEIAKGLALEATMLILDEPTSALGLDEAARLRMLVRGLVKNGRSVLYVTHRLYELPGFVDEVTVVREGSVVGTFDARQLDVDELIVTMLPLGTEQRYVRQPRSGPEPLLEVHNLSAASGIRNVSFTLHRGEVLGLAGTNGSGRTEIIRALFGADSITGGNIFLSGKPIRPRSPREAIALGIGLLPENRQTDALYFNFTGGPNITVARLGLLRRFIMLSLGRERRATRRFIHDLNITPAVERKTPVVISGGNQQKLVLARSLFANSRVLLLDEPTQGIDIGAKQEVYRVVDEVAAKGVGVVLISSEYRELLAVTDRIAIVRDRRLVTIVPTSQLDEATLMGLTAGVGERL
jgi:ribose transport system ATP-binding protein